MRKTLCYISTNLVNVWPNIRKLDSDTYFFIYYFTIYYFDIVHQNDVCLQNWEGE